MRSIPIAEAAAEEKRILKKLVRKVISAKRANPFEDVSELESEINHGVYRVYELTPDEIKLVEEARNDEVSANSPRATCCERTWVA